MLNTPRDISKLRNVPLRTALLYAAGGGLWILLSDTLLDMLAPDRAAENLWGIYKGWVFIGVTAGLLYLGLRQQIAHWAAARKASEEAESGRLRLESQLSRLAETVPGAIVSFRVDPTGRLAFTYVNRRAEEVYGLAASDLLSDAGRLLSLIHADDLPGVLAATEASRVALSRFRSEFRMQNPQRGEVWVEAHAQPEREGDGSTVWHGFVQEITERKKTEARLLASRAELHESEQRWQLALAGGNLGAWDWNVETGEVFYSERWCSIIGYDVAEIPQTFEGWRSLVHPDDLAETLRNVEAHRRGATPFYGSEHRLRARDGSYRWVLARGKVTAHDAQGRPLRMVGTHADITEQKKAEADLRIFRALVDQSEDTFEVIDPASGRYLDINENGLRHLGYSREEFLQLRVFDLDPDCTEADWADIAREIRELGSLRKNQLRRKRKDGSIFPVEIQSRWVTLEHDYVVAVVRDVTERSRAEEALNEAVRFSRATIDALSAHICVLDETGQILTTNAAWKQFAGLNCSHAGRVPDGGNYLHACEAAAASADGPEATAFLTGIRAVLRGECETFEREYACHSPTEQRWYLARVTRFSGPGPVRVVVAHENISARKLAEQSLQEREEQLRLYVEHSPVSVAMFDNEMRYLVVSRQWISDFGLTGKTILGRSHYEVIPSIPERWREIHRRCLAGAAEKCEEDTFVSPEGVTDYIRWEVQPWRRADGAIGGIIIFSERITDRKAAEAKLRESEERYRSLFNYAPDGILVGDPQSVYLDANPSMCEMLGYTHDELVGLSATDIIARSAAPEIAPTIDRIRSGADHHREWLFRRKDGSTFPVEVIATMTPDGNLLGMIRDISERQRAQQELHESQGKLAAALDSMADAVLIVDTEGRLIECNEAFATFHRFKTREECAAMFAENPEFLEISLPHGEIAEPSMCPVPRALQGESVSSEEFHLRRKDTGEKWTASYSFSPIRDQNGAIVGAVVVGRDISEQKKLEQQFLRAQRMESIGTLAGGIAHDLNNVLGPIILALDLLKMRFTDEASAELINLIESSARHGADMVSQVLSFARGVGGQRLDVQVGPLIQEIAKLTNETFLKNVRIETKIADDLPPISGDPTQLHQVLLNLCVNARDAMPQGGQITLTASNVSIDEQYAGLSGDVKPGDYVLIQVDDTGTGISPETLEKIFDPFFTTKEVGKGTGLGLSTSLAIVRSHGGFIHSYSEVGRGTTFKIYLPVKRGSSPVSAALQLEEMPRGNGELVLVVDDETSVREVTRRTLEAFGYRVLLAVDGADGVTLFAARREEIAVVVTDITMPVMDGVAMIQVLRNIHPTVPIIATSGLAASADAIRAGRFNAVWFIAKPYAARLLLGTLKQILPAKDSGS